MINQQRKMSYLLRWHMVSLMVLVGIIFNVQGLPSGLETRYNYNNLNSSSILGILANTQSNATASGLGSTVEISGIVSGDTLSSLEAQSSSSDPSTSGIASQVNCAEYSTSSASGGLSADAVASGDCIANIDNSGQHSFQTGDDSAKRSIEPLNKVAIGVEGNVNSSAAQQSGNYIPAGEGSISQSTLQMPVDGSVEAYQFVHGPQATSSFSGFVHSQGDVVHGTQETLMTHASGDTSFQSFITPFAAALEEQKKNK